MQSKGGSSRASINHGDFPFGPGWSLVLLHRRHPTHDSFSASCLPAKNNITGSDVNSRETDRKKFLSGKTHSLCNSKGVENGVEGEEKGGKG